MKGIIKITGGTGHGTVTWDTNKPETVELAEKAFNEAIQPSYRFAFAIGPDGHGTLVDKFDPQVKEYTILSQISGG